MSVNVTVTEKENVELKVVSSSTDAVQLDLGNTQHNSLVGIQGGAGGQYYHLSLAEYSNLINTDNQALYVNITGAETITGLKTFLSGIQISANSDVINITGDLVGGNKKLFIDSESLIIDGGVELKTGDLNMGTNSITNVGNIDGRDVSADGSKLDGIETAATADQTAAEIRTLVESATDSNVFTDADHTKLNTSVSITGSQTISGIKTFDSGYKINAGGQDILITGDLDGSDRKLYIDAESLIIGENEVNSLYSAAILGSGNSIFGDYNVIVAGSDNQISGSQASYTADYNFLGAGTGNSIQNSSYSSIVGGLENKLRSDSRNSFIGGGKNNTLSSSRNSVIGGGINNYIDSAESVQIFGSYVTGMTPYDGYIYLADNQNRRKEPHGNDTLFIDFEGGVEVKTGSFAVQENITMGGETVATRAWVQSQETSQRFDTALLSGIDETGIEFGSAFSSAPMVQCELQLPNGGERTYFIAVRDITTTGFFVEFSDNIGAGYVLQTRAIPNT